MLRKKYRIEYKNNKIKKALNTFPEDDKKAVLESIEKHLVYYSPLNKNIKKYKKLGIYRLRCGNYRVSFDIERDVIKIYSIQHRKNAYR